VTPAGRSSLQLSFGTNTFSQFSTDTNYEDAGAGHFEYATGGEFPGATTLSAQLTLTYQQPPDVATNAAQTLDLTFVTPGSVDFTNASSGSSGTIQYYTAADLVPKSWSNHTLLLTSAGETNTLSLTSTNGGYTATVFSPVAAWVQYTPAGDPAFGEVNYLQLQFTTTNSGNYLLEDYNNESDTPVSEQQGGFLWK
jgi:hypothetical protein